MTTKQLSPKISDYLTVREAAMLLGVSSATLRNWDNAGKLVAIRNPLSGYRLYKRTVLMKLREQLNTASAQTGSLSSLTNNSLGAVK